MKVLKATVIAVISVLLFTGVVCAGNSGFLDNYSLGPDMDREGAKVYRKPGVDLKPYTKVLIDPIEIWISPKSKYKGLNPDQLKTLADAFRHALIGELEPTYPVVSKPGPGVLGLRIAITNVLITKKKRGLLGYTPIGLVTSTAAKAMGDDMSMQEAVIEAELLDSMTNEQLGSLIDQQSKTVKRSSVSALKPVQKGKTSWEEIQSTLTYYAKRFKTRMDKDHAE